MHSNLDLTSECSFVILISMYLTGPIWFLFKIKLFSTWKLQMTMKLTGYCVSNLLRFQKILKNLKSWNKIYWLFDVSWLSRLLNFFPASLVGCWELSRRAFSLVVSKLRHRWAVSKIITTVTRKIKRQTSSSKIWRKQITLNRFIIR